MKMFYYLVAILCSIAMRAQAQFGINTYFPDVSSALDVSSSSRGFLTPRMTISQRNAIVNPATGLLVYVLNGDPGFYYFDGTSWNPLKGLDGKFVKDNSCVRYRYSADYSKDFLINTDTSHFEYPLNSGQIFQLKMMFFPSRLGAFRAGGISRFIEDDWAMNKIGSWSFASGANNQALSLFSAGLGNQVEAHNTAAIATGSKTIAQGMNSAAFGFSTKTLAKNSVTFGDSTIAGGASAFACGYQTLASGANSIAFGIGDKYSGREIVASGANSFAGGTYGTTASRASTVAIGFGTSANGICATAFNNATTAAGDYSTVLGQNSRVNVQYGFAGGYNNQVIGNNGCAFGIGGLVKSYSSVASTWGGHCTASADESAAFGYKSLTSGTASFASGNDVIASGRNSVAIGSKTIARDTATVAFGDSTRAWSIGSFASGYGSIARYRASVALGKFTKADGETSIAIGDGSVAANYSSTAVGINSAAGGWRSVALGAVDSASGYASLAIGANNLASGTYATAIGQSSNASGDYSTSIGKQADAAADVATAIGSNINPGNHAGEYSTTIGSYANNNNYDGTALFTDHSLTTSFTNNTAHNQMMMRFAGGYRLYTNSGSTSGVSLAASGNSWSTISDSTKKENYKSVPDFLSKIKTMKVGSWNYRGQDKTKFRHYGPYAQEFFYQFGTDSIGVVGNDTTIASADIDGVMFIALQQLIQENNTIRDKITALRNKNVSLDAARRKLIAKASQRLEKLIKKNVDGQITKL